MQYVKVSRKGGDTRKPSGKKRGFLLSFLVFLILVGFLIFRNVELGSFLSPLSVFSQVVNSGGLQKTDGRTNILLLGLDRRNGEYVGLTDTIILVSLDRTEGSGTTLISLPRDLWVSLGEGSYSKINAAYSKGGAKLARSVVEDVLGIPVHYFGAIDFEGFVKAIDILGGIKISVDKTFDDFYYPIPGMEDATCGLEEGAPEADDDKEDPLVKENDQFGYPCRYEQLRFEAGAQVMDGDTALKFARSRHGTNNEGNDFARAARQQKVIFAVKDTVISTNFISDIGKIKELYSTYREYVETDLGIAELEKLFLEVKDINVGDINAIVLDNESELSNGGLLFTPRDRTLYGGAYVLLPRAGDFSQIHAFIQKLLFGEN